MTPTLKASMLAALLLASAACTARGSSSVGTGGGGSGEGGGSTTGSGGAGGSGGSGPSAEQACADLAKASCDKRDACSMGFLITRAFGDLGACVTRTTALCLSSLAAPGTSQTPAKLEACVAAHPGFSCVDFFNGTPPADCVPSAGELPQGAACVTSAQCASTYCAVSQTEVCGSCQPLPVVGASCAVQTDCGRELGCARVVNAPSGVCAPWVSQGGACLNGEKPCKAGLSCVGEDPVGKTDGACQPAGAAAGTACDGSRKTMAGCDANLGLACVPAKQGSPIGTCQALQIVVAGATCGEIGGKPPTGFSVCKASALCQKAAPADPTGTCVVAAADGSPCDIDPAKGPPCLAPTKCVIKGGAGTAGTCTLSDAAACL